MPSLKIILFKVDFPFTHATPLNISVCLMFQYETEPISGPGMSFERVCLHPTIIQ